MMTAMTTTNMLTNAALTIIGAIRETSQTLMYKELG